MIDSRSYVQSTYVGIPNISPTSYGNIHPRPTHHGRPFVYCWKEETLLECYEYPGLDELGNNDSVFQLKDQQSFPGDDQVG